MNHRHKAQVVIAGAGPVGLTAALLLGAKDISVTVLEAEDRISEALRASTFHPPTLDMMAPFGITARMLEAGLVCPTWQIRLHPSGDRAVHLVLQMPRALNRMVRCAELAGRCLPPPPATAQLTSLTVHASI